MYAPLRNNLKALDIYLTFSPQPLWSGGTLNYRVRTLVSLGSWRLRVLRKVKRRVIFDSNFLFVPVQFKIDVFEAIEGLIGSFEPVVLSTTLEELQVLSKSGSKKVKREADLARLLASKCRVMNVEKGDEETCDDVILRVAKELGCPVATNDRELRRRLRREGVATIFLREKSHLEVEGAI